MRARTIGIREAKARLSQLLRDVLRGKEWIITARGKPVARFVPAIDRLSLSLEERLGRLEESGLIEPVRGQVRQPPPPLPFEEGLAQTWLQQDRGT